MILLFPVFFINLVCIECITKYRSSVNVKIYNFTLLSLSELVTTETELNDIASAANIGFSNPTAASGIPRTLYINA